jgi:hypothetical protein
MSADAEMMSSAAEPASAEQTAGVEAGGAYSEAEGSKLPNAIDIQFDGFHGASSSTSVELGYSPAHTEPGPVKGLELRNLETCEEESSFVIKIRESEAVLLLARPLSTVILVFPACCH